MHENDRRELVAKSLFLAEGKGGYQRLLPMSDELIQWVRVYLNEARGELLRQGECDVFFVNHKGIEFNDQSLWSLVRRYLIKGRISTPQATS